MKVEMMKVEALKPYERNAKAHPEKQIEGIAESIKQFGFTQPIVIDKKNNVIIGHARIEAAKMAGLNEIPVIKREDLNDTQVKALRILDNKLAESEWMPVMLAEELQDLEFDFDKFGINFDDMLKMDDEEKDGGGRAETMFIVSIELDTENEQKKLYEELNERGYKCRLIM